MSENHIYIFCLFVVVILIVYYNYSTSKCERYTNLKTPFPIDVVYTWAGEKKSLDIRLSNNNELKYSLRSVFQFMPWINHVYILMNPPKNKPSWFKLNYSKKITIVDHNDTFEDKGYLPTTNSNSIETTINNIPNLSEHFIYFNDDFFIGRPVKYTDFFTNDGKIVVYYRQVTNCGAMQKPGKKIVNFDLPIYCGISYHIPLPNKKSIINKFNDRYKKYIHWVRNIKKRNGRGYDKCRESNLANWCQQQHTAMVKFAYDNNEAVIKRYDNKSIMYYESTYDIKKLYAIKVHKPMFYCINDAYNFKNLNYKFKLYNKINEFLEHYYEKTFCE